MFASCVTVFVFGFAGKKGAHDDANASMTAIVFVVICIVDAAARAAFNCFRFNS
jgi:hypothetical protein